MRYIIKTFIIIGLIGGLAVITRPGSDAAETALKQQILAAIAREEVGTLKSSAGNLVLAGCKISPEGCYDLIRSGLRTDLTERFFTSRFEVSGFGKRAECTGAFTKFVCPGGLRDP